MENEKNLVKDSSLENTHHHEYDEIESNGMHR